MYWLLVPVLFLAEVALVRGHGLLLDPASRSTMWRLGFQTPVNYNDNGLNCGGYEKLWVQNKGKCGVCGDPYDGSRDNEAGGKYATGQIVSHFIRGQDILVTVELTVNHGGYFEFSICPVDHPDVKATENCFSKNPVVRINGQRMFILTDRKSGLQHVALRLPGQLSCRQCVLRWKYVTATTWGCEGGRCCTGCGHQEEFYGCADIEIKSLPPIPLTTLTPSHPSRSTPEISKCLAKYPWRNNPAGTPWCIEHCARGLCNRKYCEKSCYTTKSWKQASLFAARTGGLFLNSLIVASNKTFKTFSSKQRDF